MQGRGRDTLQERVHQSRISEYCFFELLSLLCSRDEALVEDLTADRATVHVLYLGDEFSDDLGGESHFKALLGIAFILFSFDH